MQKIMKSSAIKTIVVRLTAENVSEYEVDGAIFDDPYLEAATRALDKIRKNRYGLVLATIECWDKKTPEKTYRYNSYWILVNASCYKKAELLRERCKMQHGCDLAKEPMHGNDFGKS